MPFSTLFTALGASLAFSAALAQTTDAAPALQLLSAGYPRAFFFRQAEESAASGRAIADAYAAGVNRHLADHPQQRPAWLESISGQAIRIVPADRNGDAARTNSTPFAAKAVQARNDRVMRKN